MDELSLGKWEKWDGPTEGNHRTETMRINGEELEEIMRVMAEAMHSLESNPKLARLFAHKKYMMFPVEYTIYREFTIG